MKNDYLRLLLTTEQKEFIQKKAKNEMRTMTAIINKALKETYKDYPIE